MLSRRPVRFALILLLAVASARASSIAGPAISWIDSRVIANRQAFYVYKDAGSAFNNGFPSGWFPASSSVLKKLHIDPGCVYDTSTAKGCATDPTKFDAVRGTVFRVSIDPLATGEFVGFNFEDPEHYIDRYNPQTNTYPCNGSTPNCPPRGYDLTGANQVCFDVVSPTPSLGVQLGVDSKTSVTPSGNPLFYKFANQWTHQCIPFSTFGLQPVDLKQVHSLFTVVSNDNNAASGGTVLFDNIQFLPVPVSQLSVVSLPVANDTVGVIQVPDVLPGTIPIPNDQAVAGLSTTYENSLAILLLLSAGNVDHARLVGDAFLTALANDNQGLPLPVAAGGYTGLRNGTFGGALQLFNDQAPGNGLQGQIRLSGFGLAPYADGSFSNLCGPSHFCLVLDGSSGGNQAFAMLALAELYRATKDTRYLNGARNIGNWVYAELLDTSGKGRGGYFSGFPDEGQPKIVNTGKSVENNADLYRSYMRLAELTGSLGLNAEAAEWVRRARIGGDYAIGIFDHATGHFFAGSIPPGVTGPGLQPEDPSQTYETRNTYGFLDAQTFVTLAMADSPFYRNQVDWRAPMQWMLNNFPVTVSTSAAAPGGSRTFDGMALVSQPPSGTNSGLAVEFTAQAVLALRFVDALYGDQRFEIQAAHLLGQIAQVQQYAPFGDGKSLVAALVDQGDALPVYRQCTYTPFQCISQRPGMAATATAAFADLNVNFFAPIAQTGAPLPQAPVDAATFQPGLAPGGLFSIFGANLAGATTAADGTTVTVNGVNAPLSYTSAGQINGQVPYETQPGTAVAVVTVNGVAGPPVSFQVAAAAPRFFPLPGNYCLVQNEDYTLNSAANPAAAGHYIVAYLVGLGAVAPAVATGTQAPANPLAKPTGDAIVTLAAQSVTPAFLGLTPSFVGLAQLNL